MGERFEFFELIIPTDPSDIDQLGHVNNVTYVRWVQDAAVAHWKAAAPVADQESVLWIVLRHEIDYKQPAYLGDEIVARTWVGSATRLKFERHTELLRAKDRALLAKARTFWCPIDVHTRKPTLVRPELRERFSNSLMPESGT
ncbi:MAG: acyl-CoA thioesterase [Acidobacteriaceae bacterium]|nr:acyl-CoA thioesterase [Acidobacteriaceae bacterium]